MIKRRYTNIRNYTLEFASLKDIHDMEDPYSICPTIGYVSEVQRSMIGESINTSRISLISEYIRPVHRVDWNRSVIRPIHY